MANLKPVLLSLTTLVALNACQESLPDNAPLAARIERKVQVAHHRLNLAQYSRFYAHAPDAAVQAIYVDARIVGRPDETVWTTQDALPVINDGGCGVLTIEYDVANDALRSARCG